jgi:hypothetical protein
MRRFHPTLGILVDAVPASREAALAVVWRLIARGLRVDLSAPIAQSMRRGSWPVLVGEDSCPSPKVPTSSNSTGLDLVLVDLGEVVEVSKLYSNFCSGTDRAV